MDSIGIGINKQKIVYLFIKKTYLGSEAHGDVAVKHQPLIKERVAELVDAKIRIVVRPLHIK